MLLRAGYSGALVGGFVVRERDELPGEQASLVTIQVEASALYGLHSDGTEVKQVEKLLELTGFAVQAIQMPYDHSSCPGPLELSE